MNTLVTRPASGEPTLAANASSTLKRAGYGSLQRSRGLAAWPSLSTFHCGAPFARRRPCFSTFMPTAALSAGGGLRWNETAAKIASALAKIAAPRLVRRCREGGKRVLPAGGTAVFGVAAKLSSVSRVVMVSFLRRGRRARARDRAR